MPLRAETSVATRTIMVSHVYSTHPSRVFDIHYSSNQSNYAGNEPIPFIFSTQFFHEDDEFDNNSRFDSGWTRREKRVDVRKLEENIRKG